MPLNPRDPAFSRAYIELAGSGIAAEAIKTWDAGLARDPRLLVPVDLQALVVAPNTEVEHADVAVRIFDEHAALGPDGLPAERAAAPFTDLGPRPPGVYLHWAMPDGLTHGDSERAEGSGGGMGHRPLPNRWVVVRVEQGRPRRTRAWVLESERARSVGLADWSETARPEPGESRADDALDPALLTAVVGGDPAWAAVFDNVVDRFAFHDDLADVRASSGPLTYLVVGWYSDETLDPVHLGGGGSFEDLLDELGWDLDEAHLERAREAASERDQGAARVGLATRSPLWASKIAHLPQDGTVPLAGVPDALLRNSGIISTREAPWWPRQSLYHGAIFGVRPGGGRRPDAKPDPRDVHVSIGATDTESLAVMLTAGNRDDALAERLHTAFGYGLLDTFEEPDGPAALDAEVHRRAFVSTSGGAPRSERIRAGNSLEALARDLGVPGGAASGSGAPGDRTRPGREAARGAFEFSAKKADDVVDRFSDLRGRRGAQDDPPRLMRVDRAAPRRYYPGDPVVAVRGLHRSLRHGYDGRLQSDERLACRLSGDTVDAYTGLVDGRDALAGRGLGHGGIPPEVDELLAEAVLADPFGIDDLVALGAERTRLDPGLIELRLRAESALRLHLQQPGVGAAKLLGASLRNGVEASPIAGQVWRQPWVPLYLEWELRLDVSADLTGWRLGEMDYEPDETVQGGRVIALRGRSLLGPSAAQSFAAEVESFLADEEQREAAGAGVLDEASEKLLRETAAEAPFTDISSAALEGLREHLLGFDTNMAQAREGEPLHRPAPARAPLLVRGGTAQLVALRAVDAFGRTLVLGRDRLKPAVSESLTPPPGASAQLVLTPRLNPPSRLQLRLLDGSGVGEQEATIDQGDPKAQHGPVAAWLLPDHVDSALEVFAADGTPAGQLRHDPVSTGVVWEGAPGHPGPVGAAPSELLDNPFAASFATAMVQRDAADRSTGAPRSETPLSALLRAIDTTQWTIDPFAQGGEDSLAMLVGHPVAMVRAVLRLEVADDTDDYPDMDADQREQRRAAFAALAATAFEVRLGALTRTDDGLLGYFVDDDYRRLHVVHPRVLAEALPSGPHTGYLGPADATAEFNDGLEDRSEPITTPYASPEPTVRIRPGQSIRLTLLMNPLGKVHATSGVLPRKGISLLRDWIADPLQRLVPSIRVGPVLVDPKSIRMPKPSHLPADQLWTRRGDPLTWRDDPILAATSDALLPDRPAVAQEGYIRADPHPPAT